MKKTLLLLTCAALLFAGCKKEQPIGGEADGSQVTVTFTTNLTTTGVTKAVADGDGNATKVNHWVLEVRDSQNDLFYEEERDVTAGTLQQTYELKLFKGQTYSLQFWADTKGAYNTGDLTAISKSGLTANADSLDAFSANVDYTSLVSESKDVTLYRPFAQLNIITCDLEALANKVIASTYEKYAPSELKVVAKIPTTFNVKTQTAGTAAEQTLTADASYANFILGKPETTLFMDYIFASKVSADVVNIGFNFKSNGNLVEHSFTNIPLQRNYRTNIKGNLMSNDSQWTVTIDPEWDIPPYAEEQWAAGMITPVTPVENVYTINLPSELAWIAQQVNNGNTFEGKTVKLAKDIDLNNGAWTPMGGVTSYPSVAFHGTLDGNNHKILNLNCSDNTKNYAAAALIGGGHCTVKDLTIENVKVSSTHYAAALVAYCGDGGLVLNNCKVINGTITSTPEWLDTEYDNGDKVGGLVGMSQACSITGCSVEGLTIKAYRGVGGIAGAAQCAGITGNTVKNTSVTADQTVNSYGSKPYCVGAIVGQVLSGTVDESNTAENVVISPYTTDASGNYHVATKAGLFVLAAEITAAPKDNKEPFIGKTIYIEKDIDLNQEAWTPIQGVNGGDAYITFDGQGHKISNVAVSDISEDGGAGFFGHWAGDIKNLKLENVTIANTINWSGALCGYYSSGNVSDVTVSNVTITNKNTEKCKRNGGLFGWVSASSTFTNVALSNIAITGTEQLGGFIGSVQADPTTLTFTNCSIEDLTITKVGTKSVTSFGTKTGGRADGVTINGDITVSGTNTLPDGSPENGWGTVGL